MFRNDPQARQFRDRVEAGQRLAERCRSEQFAGEPLVLGLPRGGVPVAAELARSLAAPLDVLVVRKIGAPFNPELAVGAMALGGVTVWNENVLSQLGLTPDSLDDVIGRERAELERREHAYRGGRPPLPITGRSVIVVDDGVATGATMEAAVEALRRMEPREIVVAVPTCARDSERRLAQSADRVIALLSPDPYVAVGVWYEIFDQTSDAEVVRLLEEARARCAPDQ